MDFQKTEPGSDDSETSIDYEAAAVGRSVAAGLPRGVFEALADPIVQALMAADRVDPKGVEELLRRITAQLASEPGRWRFS